MRTRCKPQGFPRLAFPGLEIQILEIGNSQLKYNDPPPRPILFHDWVASHSCPFYPERPPQTTTHPLTNNLHILSPFHSLPHTTCCSCYRGFPYGWWKWFSPWLVAWLERHVPRVHDPSRPTVNRPACPGCAAQVMAASTWCLSENIELGSDSVISYLCMQHTLQCYSFYKEYFFLTGQRVSFWNGAPLKRGSRERVTVPVHSSIASSLVTVCWCFCSYIFEIMSHVLLWLLCKPLSELWYQKVRYKYFYEQWSEAASAHTATTGQPCRKHRRAALGIIPVGHWRGWRWAHTSQDLCRNFLLLPTPAQNSQ